MLPGLYLPSLPTFPYHSSHYMQKCNWYHRIRSRKRCYYQYRIHYSATSSTSSTGICLLNRGLSPMSSLSGSLILNLLMTMVFSSRAITSTISPGLSLILSLTSLGIATCYFSVTLTLPISIPIRSMLDNKAISFERMMGSGMKLPEYIKVRSSFYLKAF